MPKTKPGHSCNGKIVRVLGIKKAIPEIGNFWHIDPVLQAEGRHFTGCAERWLHPLDPCEDDLARETLERLDDELRETFVNTVVEKLK
ncbi:MAG: hypothetical protein ACO265_08410 [Polynucleobacter sp.]